MTEWVMQANTLWVRDELRPWVHSTIGLLLLLAACLIAAQLDVRTLYDISVWIKPSKFALSLAVYFATLVWFAHYVPREYFQSRWGQLLIWTPVITGWFEMIYIVVQAGLGEASHFNFTSTFHATMYSLMGFGAVTLVVVLGVYAFVIARMRSLSDPMVLAVVLGLVLTCLLGGGFGGYLGSSGGHWVAAPATDLGGAPVFGWTRQGGDLRVAHFFGMHVMQVLPLFVLLLKDSWSLHMRQAAVIAFACAYTAFTTMTFVQAIQGQPFLA